MGLNPITSIQVHYDAGAGIVSSTLNGLNIQTFGTYDFTHSVPFTIPSVGIHNVDMWVELTGDAVSTNDQMTTAIQGVGFLPNHIPVIEEATGTWCGWCPRGTVFMDSLHGENPEAILIAVHNDDPMDFGTYDDGIAGVPGFLGYPGISIDRVEVQDPSDIFTYYDNHRSEFGFANVGVSAAFNATTRQCDVTATASFAASLNGSYRFAVVFTEDGVTGSGDGSNANAQDYDQVNYYSYQSSNLALVGAGKDWQQETNPVPATEMEYDFVARAILPSFQGQAGSLPSSIAAGSYHQYSFTYTVPAGYDETRMRVIALLIDATSGQILNANKVDGIQGSVGTKQVAQSGLAMTVFPNPSGNDLQVSFGMENEDQISVVVSNMMGQELIRSDQGMLSSGIHQLQLDLSGLPAGTYNVSVAGKHGLASQTVIKQ
jgi:hypothetical protein